MPKKGVVRAKKVLFYLLATPFAIRLTITIERGNDQAKAGSRISEAQFQPGVTGGGQLRIWRDAFGHCDDGKNDA